MEYTYKKLKGKIVEVYGSQAAFANDIGITKQSMSNKMNHKIGLTYRDVVNWSKKLGITTSDIGEYFFT